MSTASLLPADYGYVLAGLFATFAANITLMMGVGAARKKFGVKLPVLYATAAMIDPKGKLKDQSCVDAYNCAQRAHQNTVESMATVQIFAVVEGLMFPRFAGGCLALYAVGRVLYGYGYRNNGASGRLAGSMISHLGDLPLNLGMGYCALVMLGYV